MKESEALLQFVITGCMIELSIFVLLSASLILVHLFLQHQKKRMELETKRIKSALLNAIKTGNLYFPKDWIKGGFQKRALLNILEDLELKLGDKIWQDVRDKVIDLFLIPTARQYIRSLSWEKRNFAIRTLVLIPREEEERFVRKILSDSAPINRVYAGRAAIRIGSHSLLSDFFQTVHDEPPRALYIFRDQVLLAEKHVFDWIINQLKTEKRNNLRLIYLDVLSHKYGYKALHAIEPDLKSDDAQVRFLAAKIITTFTKNEEKIMQLLGDSDEKIRGMAARALPPIMGNRALIPLKKLLDDDSWWTRLQAAIALRNIGRAGVVALQAIREGEKAREAADHALNLPAGVKE